MTGSSRSGACGCSTRRLGAGTTRSPCARGGAPRPPPGCAGPGPPPPAGGGGGPPPLPARGDSYIVLGRRDYVVTLTTLDRASWEALQALAQGAPVGAWLERARQWAALGYLR